MAMQDIRITIGFRAQVNGELELSIGAGDGDGHRREPHRRHPRDRHQDDFDLETMQNVPSARDPWVMLERRPASPWTAPTSAAASRASSPATSRAASSTGNNKWSIDGVDITDKAATGASPIYYDFDMLEEMQVTTGGEDVTQQTGGVGINLVTKSGSDTFKGSGRCTGHRRFVRVDNITDELRAQGAGSGAPIQNIKDYGFEVGGPIRKAGPGSGAATATQDIKVGVVGFYKDTPACRPTPPTDTRGAPRLSRRPT